MRKYQRIAASLRLGIADGRYPPGSRLPGENDLMAGYGVARGTARQALAQVVTEGLAQAVKGAGTFVCEPPVNIPFVRLMEYAASLTAEDLQEPLAQLAARAGVFPERLADALEAVRVCNGVTPADIRAVDDEVVARALEADRRGLASGFAAPDLFSE